MNFNDAIADMKRRPLTDFFRLEKSKNGLYCCPICRSGKGPNQTGALKIYPGTNRVCCFSGWCFGQKGEDTPGALALILKCSLPEVITRAGYKLDKAQGTPQSAPREKREPQQPPKVENFKEKYKVWHDNLLKDEAAIDYLHKRGINDEAIEHFNIGYASDWVHPSNEKYQNAAKEPRLIFPRSVDAYSARTMNPDVSDKYKVIKKCLFNEAGLTEKLDQKMPIVVVEGEIDAIMIWQCDSNFPVVGLGSINAKDLFVAQAKEKNPNAIYLLALDNDDAGRKTQEYIAGQLEKAGIGFISADTADLYGGEKDAGDAAQHDKDAFTKRLISLLDKAYNERIERDKAEEIEAYNRSGPGMVDSFLQAAQTKRYQPISSGIASVDRAIGGGFIRGTVVMLGAAPGMGKTTLISQICENIAGTGTDVLFLNLEMSREILLARSITRIANSNGSKITVNEILRGYDWNDSTREIIEKAANEYKGTIAGHLIYNPGEPETDIDRIIKKIEDERRRLGHAPIVCIDYLQLLTGRQDEGTIEVIKRAVQTLKQYANDNHTIVFIVIANNRDSMRTGESSLLSGRDSSNIEYGADMHLGLEYASVGSVVKDLKMEDGEPAAKIEKGKDLSFIGAVKKTYLRMIRKNADVPPEHWSEDDKILCAVFRKYCTQYTVRVNKNRYGDGEATATLIFDGASSRFAELDTIHTEPPPYVQDAGDAEFESVDAEDIFL